MNRELKFRAWDKENKRIVDAKLLMGRCDLNSALNSIGFYKNWKIMQFTGLKDKKGKEIYEGDLVQGKYRHEPQEVFWVDDHACFSIGDVCTKRPGDASGYWEIVGNIYENPELLNK